ncbi:MAG: NAD-dependent epimerase/dehydratase family protein [Caldilinea sp. CFX5]|nr:NAD-dependent epimerase/dehydratase family protein [Caldilinea sp. CFX5]
MRILITGGAGFIGSHLANQLHHQGHFVRVLDDLSSGDPTKLPTGINFSRGDVRDIPKLWSLLQGVEVVYHLAARVSVPASVLYPREYNDVNVGGTVALLEACRDVGVRRVILASSATIYGNQIQQPVHEEMAPQPTVPYAVSKLAAEQFLFIIGRLAGFETVALRIFNAYGPGQPLPPVHAPVIPQFMHQILGGGSVVVQGDGSQTRDFVFIDDVVKALMATADAAGVDQQIINIGSGLEITVNTLIERIAQTVERKANILYNRETSGGVARLVADLSKARRLLGYTPAVDIATGLQRLLQRDPLFRPAQMK